jgi:hypothetical protein
MISVIRADADFLDGFPEVFLATNGLPTFSLMVAVGLSTFKVF